MNSSDLELIGSLNAQIEPRALLEAIGFRAEKALSIGEGLLKACCPLCKQDRYSTLLVTPGKNTYRCIVQACQGHMGGTLVDLYARWSGTPGIGGAVAAARATGLSLDGDIVRRLADRFLADATAALGAEDLESARANVLQAREIDTSNEQIPLVSARIAEQSGDTEQAIQDFAVAARLARRNLRFDDAERIIRDDMLRLKPDDENNLLELADTLGATRDLERRDAVLLQLCTKREEQGRIAENVSLFERLRPGALTDPNARLRYGRALAAKGDAQAAIGQLLQAAEDFEDRSAFDGVIAALEAHRELDQRNRSSAEKLASAYETSGHTVEAIGEYARLGELLLKDQDPAGAERAYMRILALDEESLSALEGLAEICRRTDRRREEAEHRVRAADLYESMGLDDQATEALAGAREADPENAELRLRYARRLLSESNPGLAHEEFFSAGSLILAQGAAERGIAVLRELSDRVPLHAEWQARLFDALRRADQLDAAMQLRAAHAKRLLTAARPDEALAVAESGLMAAPGDIGLADVRWRALAASGDVPAAMKAMLELHPALLDAGLDTEAETNLRDAIAMRPDEIDARELLAAFLESRERHAEALGVRRQLLSLSTDQPAERRRDFASRLLDLDATDVTAMERLAEAEVELGDPSAALGHFIEAAEALADRGGWADAERCASRAVELAPADARALWFSGRARAGLGDREGASESLSVLIETAADEEPLLRQAWELLLAQQTPPVARRLEFARWLVGHGETEAAKEQLALLDREALEVEDGGLRIEALRGLVALDRLATEPLMELAEALANAGEDREAVETYRRLAEVLAEAGEAAEAAGALGALLELEPTDEAALDRLAGLQIERGESALAVEALTRLTTARSDAGREVENVETFERILEIDPQNRSIRRRLAETLEATEKRDLAFAQWCHLARDEQEANRPAEVELAWNRAKALDSTAVEPRESLALLYEELFEEEKFKAEALGLIDLLEDKDKHDEAAKWFESLKDKFPDDYIAEERMAESHIRRGEVAEGAKLLRDLVTRYEKDSKRPEAMRIVERILEVEPLAFDDRARLAGWRGDAGDAEGSFALWLATLRLAIEHKKDEAAETAIAGAAAQSPSEWPRRRELCRVLLEAERNDAALEQLHGYLHGFADFETPERLAEVSEFGLEFAPRDERLLQAGLDADEALGRPDAFVEKGLRLAEILEPEEALRVLARLQATSPNRPEPKRMAARLFEETGQVVSARDQLLALAEIALKAGDDEAAEKDLRHASQLVPDDSTAGAALAEFLRAAGRTDEAVDEYLRLARLSREGLGRELAIPLFEAALAIESARDDVRTELARLLADLGQKREARGQLMQVARRALEGGEGEEGAARVREALAVDTDDTEGVLDGFELLSRHGQGKAARALAIEATQRRLSSARPDEAYAVLEAARRAEPEDTELLRLMVRAQIAREHQDRALELLAELAGLHREKGERDREEEVWREVLELDEGNSRATEALVESLLAQDESRRQEAIDLLQEQADRALENGRVDEGIAMYRRLTTISPDDLKLRDRVARLYLENEEYERAGQEFAALGEAYRALGESAVAIDYFEKALEFDSENVAVLRAQVELTRSAQKNVRFTEYSIRLAAAYAKSGMMDLAIETAAGIVAADPANSDAWLLLANYHEKNNDADAAIRSYVGAAQALIDRRLPQRALALLGKLSHLEATEVESLEALGQVEIAAGALEEGLRHLAVAVEAYEDAGLFDRALAASEPMLTAEPNDPELRERRATILERMERHDDAASEWMALVALLGEDRMRARSILEHAIKLAPAKRELRVRLAEVLADLGRDGEAIAQFVHVAESCLTDGEADSALHYAKCASLLDDSTLAVHDVAARAEEAAGNNEGAVRELLWIGRHHLEAERLAEARAAFARAGTLDADNLEVNANLAAVLKHEGKMDEACDRFVRLAELYGRGSQHDESVKMLRSAIECRPEDLSLRRALAELYDRLGRPAEAAEESFAVARIHLTQGLVEEARETLARVLKETTDSNLHRRAADLYTEAGIPELAADEWCEAARKLIHHRQFDEAREACRAALKLQPRAIDARELLVVASKELGDIDGACMILGELADLFQESGAHERAAEVLEAMVAFRPLEPLPHERLALVYSRLGRIDRQIEELRLLADIQRSTGQTDQALVTLKRLLETRPDDTRARVQYIESYREKGDERDLIEDYIALAAIHSRHGEATLAKDVLLRVAEIDPTNTAVRESLVGVLLESGETAEALRQAIALSETMVERNQAREALAVLQRLATKGQAEASYHLALARAHRSAKARGMALQELEKAAVLFEHQGDLDSKAAVLEEILEIDGQNIETRRELIDVLNKQDDKARAMAQQLALGDVFVARGFLDLAEQEYREVLKTDPANEQAWHLLFQTLRQLAPESEMVRDYLAHGAVMYRHERWDEVIASMTRVMRLDPSNIEAREYYVRAYAKVGRELDLCEDYLELADLMVAAGRIDEAVSIFSRVLALDPAHRAARDRLTQTQARVNAGEGGTGAKFDFPALAPVPDQPEDEGKVETVDGALTGPAKFLDVEVSAMDDEDEREALRQVIESYEDILAINAQNANVRIKLAELLEQIGREQEALDHLSSATETLLQKGELNLCVEVCERILKSRPADQKVRLRLKQAFNKRDAFKALESAIHLTERAASSDAVRRPRAE